MCQRLCLHFRINSGEAVVSSSFWFIDKKQIRGCVFHSEWDYQLKLRMCFHKGWHPQCWRCGFSIWMLSSPVFSHTFLWSENHFNLHTLTWMGLCLHHHLTPCLTHDLDSLILCVTWTLFHSHAIFWKVLGSSFEGKIEVSCLRYSTMGISPSRQYGQECIWLVFKRWTQVYAILLWK